MSLTSDEVNFLVYRYLLEAGKPCCFCCCLGSCERCVSGRRELLHAARCSNLAELALDAARAASAATLQPACHLTQHPHHSNSRLQVFRTPPLCLERRAACRRQASTARRCLWEPLCLSYRRWVHQLTALQLLLGRCSLFLVGP